MQEVQISIPVDIVHTFLLIGRRLRGYADQGMLVDPAAAGRLGEMILDQFPMEAVAWLDTLGTATATQDAVLAASSSGLATGLE